MTLGQTICRLRKEKNLSQDGLAGMLEVSRQSVSKWETDASVPELDKLIKLSEIFQISLDELVGLSHQPQPPTPPALPTALPVRSITGIALLCTGVLPATILTAVSGHPLWLLSGLPFWICGIICLLCSRRTGLWCAWALFLLSGLLIQPLTGQQLFLGRLMHYSAAGAISLIWTFIALPLYAATAYSFRNIPLTDRRKNRLLLGGSGGIFLLTCLLPDLLNRLQTRNVPQGAAARSELMSFLVFALINLIQILSLAILITVLTILIRQKGKK